MATMGFMSTEPKSSTYVRSKCTGKQCDTLPGEVVPASQGRRRTNPGQALRNKAIQQPERHPRGREV